MMQGRDKARKWPRTVLQKTMMHFRLGLSRLVSSSVVSGVEIIAGTGPRREGGGGAQGQGGRGGEGRGGGPGV
jgi:hypothetical protein